MEKVKVILCGHLLSVLSLFLCLIIIYVNIENLAFGKFFTVFYLIVLIVSIIAYLTSTIFLLYYLFKK